MRLLKVDLKIFIYKSLEKSGETLTFLVVRQLYQPDYDDVSPYSYVESNPINNYDPDGMSEEGIVNACRVGASDFTNDILGGVGDVLGSFASELLKLGANVNVPDFHVIKAQAADIKPDLGNTET